MKNRYEMGVNKLKEVDGTGGKEVVESLKNIAPDLGKYIIEFTFGDIYTRSTFDLKHRELVTLSELTALGECKKQLRVPINWALNVGISEKEIVEVFYNAFT